MKVELIEASRTDPSTLGRLMQLSIYDFSELLNLEVGAQGLFEGGTPP